MGTDRGNAPIFKNGNAAGAANGSQTMRDDQHGASLHQVGQRGLHQRLAFGVKGRGGLIENQNRRIFEDGAGNGQALALAAGKAEALFADHCVVTLRHAEGEVVQPGGAASQA